MDHIVYLDHKSDELNALITGEKDIILRGATGRKLPYNRVKKSDVLYFCVNDGSGTIYGKGLVKEVFFSEKLTKEESMEMIDNHLERIKLSGKALSRFYGKRYLSFVFLESFSVLPSFQFDKTAFGNMDDWLLVEDINRVKIV